jgi:hypothetical protein
MSQDSEDKRRYNEAARKLKDQITRDQTRNIPDTPSKLNSGYSVWKATKRLKQLI